MKALVISDRSEIIDYVTPLLKEKGFDLIHYRWIIKALDNIEEIQPDIIVLSSMEYPRHWKTLAGFVQSGIGGNNVKMYLYDTNPLSTDDAKKAYDLGILSFEENFKKDDSFLDVDDVPAANENESVKEDDDFISMDSIDTKDVELAYNDMYGRFSFCNAKYNPGKECVQFTLNLSDAEEKISNGFIKYVTMFDGSSCVSFSANAKKENDSICFYIKDYYEKTI